MTSFRDLPNPYAESIKTISLSIGEYTVHAVPTGLFGLDGGAMFGTVPKVLWEKSNPCDQSNRIAMEARALLLKSSRYRILVDCGIGGDFVAKYGEKLGGKFEEMYAIDRSSKSVSLQSSLHRMGVSSEDITHVILTHLHFDHAGGATRAENGMIVPAFKNARYFIQRANLETAKLPNRREKASYFPVNFESILADDRMEILNGPVQDLLPGVSVAISNGHTLGQQYVRISDEKSTLYYCGDLIPTSSHVRLPWVMGYDLRPLELIEEKAALLESAAKESAFLFFEHDPYVDLVKVCADRGDFSVQDRFCLV
jgi:glyoxylase-like metal-dependent hydrolase (beta-lactamase superfamily II)